MWFCKNEISVRKRKAEHVLLFLYVYSDDLLKRSKYVTPLNAHILSCIYYFHVAINLKHSGTYNLKIVGIQVM
jgi:hypothetical protein